MRKSRWIRRNDAGLKGLCQTAVRRRRRRKVSFLEPLSFKSVFLKLGYMYPKSYSSLVVRGSALIPKGP